LKQKSKKREACGKKKTNTPQRVNTLSKVIKLLVSDISWFGVKLKLN
jgi:hypothetical protein